MASNTENIEADKTFVHDMDRAGAVAHRAAAGLDRMHQQSKMSLLLPVVGAAVIMYFRPSSSWVLDGAIAYGVFALLKGY